jgi:gamma-glutamyl-gamma-aminobutyrate hydrolase PuuD
MRRMGITQRVENYEPYNERRDCLDQRWSKLAFELGFNLIPLPNVPRKQMRSLLSGLSLDALVLSGGNSISGDEVLAPDAAPERDLFESELIRYSISNSIPLLGVCRGMQMINLYFKGSLSPVSGHVASRHMLTVSSDFAHLVLNEVNSFHTLGIGGQQLGENLISFAVDNEGFIEGFTHESLRISGLMWHPEREEPSRFGDLGLMRKFLL